MAQISIKPRVRHRPHSNSISVLANAAIIAHDNIGQVLRYADVIIATADRHRANFAA